MGKDFLLNPLKRIFKAETYRITIQHLRDYEKSRID